MEQEGKKWKWKNTRKTQRRKHERNSSINSRKFGWNLKKECGKKIDSLPKLRQKSVSRQINELSPERFLNEAKIALFHRIITMRKNKQSFPHAKPSNPYQGTWAHCASSQMDCTSRMARTRRFLNQPEGRGRGSASGGQKAAGWEKPVTSA